MPAPDRLLVVRGGPGTGESCSIAEYRLRDGVATVASISDLSDSAAHAFSPGGRWLVDVERGRGILLRDLTTGDATAVHAPLSRIGLPTGLALSRDGGRLLILTKQALYVVETATQRARGLTVKGELPQRVAISADGSRAVGYAPSSEPGAGMLAVWGLDGPDDSFGITCAGGDGMQLEISPEGRYATVLHVGRAELFDLAERRIVASLPREGMSVGTFLDGTRLCLAKLIGPFDVIDASSGARLDGAAPECMRRANAMAVSRDGRHALVGTIGADVALHDLVAGAEVWRRPLAKGGGLALEFGPRDEGWVGTFGGEVTSFALATGERRGGFPIAVSSLVTLAPGATRIAFARDRAIAVVTPEGSPVATVPFEAATDLMALEFGRSTDELIAITRGEGLERIELGPTPRRIPAPAFEHPRTRSRLRVAKDGRNAVVAFASKPRAGAVLSLGDQPRVLRTLSASVRSFDGALLEGGEALLLGGDGALRLYDASGSERFKLPLGDATDPGRALALLPDEQTVVVATARGVLHRIRVVR
jgi:hypothetical protein